MRTPRLAAPFSSSSCPTTPIAFLLLFRHTSFSPHFHFEFFPIVSRIPTTKRAYSSIHPRLQASSSSASSPSPLIEKEIPEAEKPPTFLRETDGARDTSNSVRARFEKTIREVQDSVCSALEAVDGGVKFKEDVWSRPGRGGGISRVLQDCAV